MKKLFSTGLFVSLSLLITEGCKPSHNNTITGGGKGGHATLRVTTSHHGEFVDTCTVYIKYGATDAPASGVYDDSAVCSLENGKPVATFSGLTVGNYYVFGMGYHGAYSPPNVRGGKVVVIAKEETDSVVVPTYQY